MKKILVLAAAALLILCIFAACGTKEEMKDDLTTMMSEMSTAMDEMFDGTEGRGNVTEDETKEKKTTAEKTTEDITDIEGTDELLSDISEGITEAESKARSIIDDITE